MTSAAVDELVRCGRSLFDRGLAHGSAGNLSMRVGGRVVITPTNSGLGRLDGPLSTVAVSGEHLDGPQASKELPVHLAFYRSRPEFAAVVHLHCTHAVAVSCLPEAQRLIPPLTAYYVMRVGELGHVGYHPPGSTSLGAAVAELASRHHAVLLANHGPVVAGTSISAAVDAIEELEETARLHLLLRTAAVATLNANEVEELQSL